MAGLTFQGQGTYIPSQTAATSPALDLNRRNAGLQIMSPVGGLTYQSPGSIPNTMVPQQSTGGTVAGASTTRQAPVQSAPAGPTPQQVAEQTKQANLAKARNSITGLVNNIRGVYEALYGDVGTAAAEKTGQVEQKYGVEERALTDQFNEQFPAIGRAFSGRNTYDSSYRINAEEGAKKGFANTLEQQNMAKQAELAGIGQFLQESRAGIEGGKGTLDLVIQQINQSDNEQELQSVMNELQAKMTALQQQRAGSQPQNFYLQKLNETVPSASRLPQLQATLANVIGSSVPGPVKQSIVTQLINNASLSPQEKEQIMAQYMGQINAEQDRVVA